MTPLSMTDLSELKIGRNLRMRTGAKAIKRRLPKKPKKRVDPSPPFPFLEPPKPSTPREQTPTPSDSQHLPSPTLSLNISISNDAPPSDNPNAIPSPSSPAAPARFTKVTNWESMQRFQERDSQCSIEELLQKRRWQSDGVRCDKTDEYGVTTVVERRPGCSEDGGVTTPVKLIGLCDDTDVVRMECFLFRSELGATVMERLFSVNTEWLEVGVASTGVLHPLEVLDRIDSLTLPFANHFMEFQYYVIYFLANLVKGTCSESSSSNWIGSNLGTSSIGKATGTSTTNSSVGSLVRWVTRTSTGSATRT
nr:hypothetical protein Iba_chr07bCG6540 [Ipomoea batatas]